MQQPVVFEPWQADPAAHRTRDPVQRIAEMGPDPRGKIARQVFQGLANDFVADLQEFGRVVAGLYDYAVRFTKDQ